jgi:hypothetical protein
MDEPAVGCLTKRDTSLMSTWLFASGHCWTGMSLDFGRNRHNG